MAEENEKAQRVWLARARRWAPFVAFVCGFVFDSVTLGTEVSELDLYLVTFYGTMALAMIVVRSFELPQWLLRYSGWALQFCLGGSLSAVVVLYFKSTGQLASYLFVGAVFFAMIVNELAHRDEPQRKLVWAMWCVSAAMLTNFVVPHVVGDVSWIYFYASVAAAVAVILVVRKLAKAPWATVRPALASATILAFAWLAGVVPPVPLVMKNTLVCTDFVKAEYSCAVEAPSLWARLQLTAPMVTLDEDDAAHYLTAVFAPRGVDAIVLHRWYRETEDGWKQTDEMSFRMTGGRKGGWRFWSRKRYATPGLWRVETALQGGGVLAYETFEVVRGQTTKRREHL